MNSAKASKLQELQWIIPGLFYAVYHQKEPLYTKNQNTKFLHGAGDAGYGFLENDWMAGTLDPLPFFTALIRSLYLSNAIEVTYVFFGFLLLIYFYSLGKIAQNLFPELRKTAPMIIYLGLFFFIHKANPSGLADQYLLGKYFQPCVFGVFLLLSIERFLNNHAKTASVLLALSAAFHPTYLPTALIVQANYSILTLIKEKQGLQKAIVPFSLFALLSAPLVIRYIILFSPTTEPLYTQAMNILANQRIPHHTDIRLWLESESFLQLGVMLLSILLIRKSRLFPIMSSLYLVIVVSGLYLYFFPNATLAFSTPWRSSVFLAPLAIAILAGWLGQTCSPFFEHHKKALPIVTVIIGTLVTLLTIRQIQKQVNAFERYDNGKEMNVIDYAARHASSEDLYLVPPENSAFDKFRLETGIPILINTKTHPYKDTEIIEWDTRCKKAQAFYSSTLPEKRIQTLADLIETYPITHCIINSTAALPAGFPGKRVYRDPHYTILKLSREKTGESG
ncbi:DUF6798 domain-containing protein [Prosthecochloris sp.]|uniref:DUF6798 domain-containing protein n=1 Tax=Prosthecochloris sp. TaxID=290513 RepID=UPI0025F7A6D5|nr:DUF6798 domain-containing protein [Prosthecochloris sp.]